MDENIINLLELDDHQAVELPDELPLMAVRDMILFPSMVVPLFVGRDSSVAAINEALEGKRFIFLVTQKEASEEDPSTDDLYHTGVVAMIIRTLQLPDGRIKILVQALLKGTIRNFIQKKPYFRVRINVIREEEQGEISIEKEALIRNVREQAERLFNLKGILTPEMSAMLNDVEEAGRLADIVASHLTLKPAAGQKLLELTDPVNRLEKVNELLSRELEVSTVQAKIQSEAKEEMSRTQREYSFVSN